MADSRKQTTEERLDLLEKRLDQMIGVVERQKDLMIKMLEVVEKLMEESPQAASAPNNNVEIWVYTNKSPCSSHPKAIESVTAYVTSMRTMQEHPLNINYCNVCGRYYINTEQYNEYARRYGHPILNLCFDEEAASDKYDYSTWQQESVLHFMGYNVNAEADLSPEERREVLVTALDNEILTKAQVVSFLEGLIYRGKRRYNMRNAVLKWSSDLEYIRDYQLNTQRKVKGTFYLR